jgi:hypothetical protein
MRPIIREFLTMTTGLAGARFGFAPHTFFSKATAFSNSAA